MIVIFEVGQDGGFTSNSINILETVLKYKKHTSISQRIHFPVHEQKFSADEETGKSEFIDRCIEAYLYRGFGVRKSR